MQIFNSCCILNGVVCLHKGKCHTSPGFINVNVGHGQLEAGKAGNVRCVPLTSQRTLFCRHRFKSVFLMLNCFLMGNDPVRQPLVWVMGRDYLLVQPKAGRRSLTKIKCVLAFTYFDGKKNLNTDWLKKKKEYYDERKIQNVKYSYFCFDLFGKMHRI